MSRLTTDLGNQVKPMGKCKQTYVALIVFGLLVVLWNVYILTYGPNYIEKDPFNKKIINIDWLENCCSWWPILHFIGFTILGYLYPYCEKLLFLAGVAWELLEVVINKIIRGTTKKQPMRLSGGTVEYSEIWWDGSIKDIVFNTAGIILGRYIRLTFNPPNPPKEESYLI